MKRILTGLMAALNSLAKSGIWKDGKRFSGNESQSEVMDWVN